MIPMRLREIAAAVRAPHDHRFERVMVKRVTTDSRDVEPHDLFLAIHGERFDGHRFIVDAASKGAAACICDERWLRENPGDVASLLHCVAVPDTVAALGRLAAYYRRHVMDVATVVVGVTGTNGKTTTKHMLDHVLQSRLVGRAAPKNYNNHIGAPLTLLSANAGDQYLIVEIGTNAPGEVAALATVASPHAAVITSIGEGHLAGLGSVADVAAEKASLLRHVRPNGLMVVNVDRPEIHSHLSTPSLARLITIGTHPSARLSVAKAAGDMRRTTFELDGRFTVELPMPGKHHATNAAATFAVARWLGLAPERIIERFRTFAPPEGRSHVMELEGITLVDDAYNANPSSMAAAIEALRAGASGRRVLVMGDMLELGEAASDYHHRAVRAALAAGVEVLIAVGSAMPAAAEAVKDAEGMPLVIPCRDAEEASEQVVATVAPGDTVWIKGSRGVGLDRVVRDLLARHGRQAAVA